MIKLENGRVRGLDAAIRGMRNPMNSWDKSDSTFGVSTYWDDENQLEYERDVDYLGENDLQLMKSLVGAGSDHRKFMRFIIVTVDVTAPLYWWKEFDTYKVGTVSNSCSTMHKIHEKEFTIDDFSHEHLANMFEESWPYSENVLYVCNGIGMLKNTIEILNRFRTNYIMTKDKKFWWQMIQLLPSSYNQRRTVLVNYEVLFNIYHARKNHKLDEWRQFCEWIESLPYADELISEV